MANMAFCHTYSRPAAIFFAGRKARGVVNFRLSFAEIPPVTVNFVALVMLSVCLDECQDI